MRFCWQARRLGQAESREDGAGEDGDVPHGGDPGSDLLPRPNHAHQPAGRHTLHPRHTLHRQPRRHTPSHHSVLAGMDRRGVNTGVKYFTVYSEIFGI